MNEPLRNLSNLYILLPLRSLFLAHERTGMV
jgi:hypothetical protein